jgi:hypothetical protein
MAEPMKSLATIQIFQFVEKSSTKVPITVSLFEMKRWSIQRVHSMEDLGHLPNRNQKAHTAPEKIIQRARGNGSRHGRDILDDGPDEMVISWKGPGLRSCVIDTKLLDKLLVCNDGSNQSQVIADEDRGRRACKRCLFLNVSSTLQPAWIHGRR